MAQAAAKKVVVVGAGMGGLCAAIRLAAAGLSVTLVEAHATPGGKMRTVPSDAGPVDAGPTVLTLRHVFEAVFAAAGERLEDHLTLIAQPILARHWWPDGSQLDLFTDPAQSAAAIEGFAGPKAAEQFLRFNAMSAQLYQAFEAPVMLSDKPRLGGILANTLRSPALWSTLLPQQTLARQLSQTFTDPRLRQLFGRYATYVGGAPDRSPAVLALIWQAETQGVWAVQGGMHALARALAGVADRLGVAQLYGTPVEKIVQKAGRVAQVILSDGRALDCDAVVFNCDPAALEQGFLGADVQRSIPGTAVHPRSLSAWVWSFAAEPKGADLIHHNVFFNADPAQEFGPIAQGKMPQDGTLYVCAQDRALGPVTGLERFEIILNAPAKTTLSPHEVLECRAKTFPPLAKFGLTFSPQPPDTALMTPQGFATRFPASQGALYGRSPHGALASFQRPTAHTRLRGLYLAGGGAHPGAGVPMAALSGKHAAEAILNDLTLA